MRVFLSLSLLTLFIFFTYPAHAQQVNLSLPPHTSKVFTNDYGWTINATCTIETTGKNKLVVQVLENNGSINGNQVNKGQTLSVLVHDQDSLSVSATPSTKITLQNTGNNSIQASCST